MYSRTINQRLDAPDRNGARGQAVFRSWICWGWALWAWLVLLLKHTLRNIMRILEPFDSSQSPPIEWALEGRQFFVLFIEGIPFLPCQAQSGSIFGHHLPISPLEWFFHLPPGH
jgi:hypothetical protein